MLFNRKNVLSFACGLATVSGALAVVLQDTSGQPYGGHVDYVFNLVNADIYPVSPFRLLGCQCSSVPASRMDTLAPLFLSMGEPFHHLFTLPIHSDLFRSYISQFHGPTIFATKGDQLNVCCLAQLLIRALTRL